jgi:uncharacterized membrane protein
MGLPFSQGEAGLQDIETMEVGRFKSFSDGVFAIAATLLAINIHMPEQEDLPLGDLMDKLWPQIMAFLISFLVATSYWRVHNRLFLLLHRVDGRLGSINTVLLAAVCLLPFSSSLIAGPKISTTSIILYASTTAFIGYINAGMWLYAAFSPHLMAPSATKHHFWPWFWQACITPTVFLISAAIAPYSGQLAMQSWFLLALLVPLARRLLRR